MALDPSFHQSLVDIGYRKVPSKFATQRMYYRDTPIQQPANRAVLHPLLKRHGFKKQDTTPESWDNGRATVIFHPVSKTWKQHRLEVVDPDDTSGGDFEWAPTPERVSPGQDVIKPKKPKRPKGGTISLSGERGEHMRLAHQASRLANLHMDSATRRRGEAATHHVRASDHYSKAADAFFIRRMRIGLKHMQVGNSAAERAAQAGGDTHETATTLRHERLNKDMLLRRQRSVVRYDPKPRPKTLPDLKVSRSTPERDLKTALTTRNRKTRGTISLPSVWKEKSSLERVERLICAELAVDRHWSRLNDLERAIYTVCLGAKLKIPPGHRLAKAKNIKYFRDIPIGHAFSADHWGKPGRTKFIKRDHRTGTDIDIFKKQGHQRGWGGRTQFNQRDIVIHHAPAEDTASSKFSPQTYLNILNKDYVDTIPPSDDKPQQYLKKLRSEYDDLNEKGKRETNNEMLHQENQVQQADPAAPRSPLEQAAAFDLFKGDK